MMSAKPATKEKGGVTLLRMGIGKEEFALPEGSTLGDLLRAARVDAATQTLFIDGKPLEESLVLRPGTIVSAVPRVVSALPQAKEAAPREGWSDVIGAFANNPEFDAMMEVVNAEREAEKEQERSFSIRSPFHSCRGSVRRMP
jgi:hypothetical protein